MARHHHPVVYFERGRRVFASVVLYARYTTATAVRESVISESQTPSTKAGPVSTLCSCGGGTQSQAEWGFRFKPLQYYQRLRWCLHGVPVDVAGSRKRHIALQGQDHTLAEHRSSNNPLRGLYHFRHVSFGPKLAIDYWEVLASSMKDVSESPTSKNAFDAASRGEIGLGQ
jgi:hypothetical protein